MNYYKNQYKFVENIGLMKIILKYTYLINN